MYNGTYRPGKYGPPPPPRPAPARRPASPLPPPAPPPPPPEEDYLYGVRTSPGPRYTEGYSVEDYGHDYNDSLTDTLDWAFGGNAREAGNKHKEGLYWGAYDLRDVGKRTSQMYQNAGQQHERDIFDPAERSLGYYRDTYLNNRPNHVEDAYTGISERLIGRTPQASAYGRAPVTSGSRYYAPVGGAPAGGGVPGRFGPNSGRGFSVPQGPAPGTASQDLYNRNRRSSGPTYVRDAYGNLQFSNNGEQAFDARKATGGYTPSVVTQRRMQRESAGPTTFDRYLSGRLGQGTEPTYLRGIADKLGDTGYASARTDAVASSLANFGGDSGAMLKDLREGRTHAGKLLGRTGDYTETFGVGDTYDAVVRENERPSYSEDFYLSSLTGENPAYSILKKDFSDDTRRAAAARGGFVSGKAMDLETRGLARLAGEEYERRGMLAGQADTAKQARLGTRITAGTALDQAILGNKNYLSDLSLGIDKMAADLSMERDRLIAELASKGDISQQTAAQLQLEGAKAVDTSQRDRIGQMDTISMRGGELERDRERDLDALYTTEAGDVFEREKAFDELGFKADQERRLGNAGRIDAAKAATGEYEGNRDHLRELAKDSDTSYINLRKENRADEQLILDAAKAASGERQEFLTGLGQYADREIELAGMRSTVRQAMDMAAIGALSQSQISAIELDLQRAGVDSKVAQALGENLRGLLMIAIEGGKAIAGGGKT